MLTGDRVGVYQDIYLQMIEGNVGKMIINGDVGKNDSDEGVKEIFEANRPFLIVLELGGEIAAIGRISNPNWCKYCTANHTQNGGNQTQDEESDKNIFQRIYSAITG